MGESRAFARVMPASVATSGQAATLAACAAWSGPDDVHAFCRATAVAMGRTPMAVRYWLARLWGAGLVELGRTRPTQAGWVVVEGRRAA